MSKQIIDNGGPAFPVLCDSKDGKPYQGMQTANTGGWWEGLSIRDWFAAHALIALTAGNPITEDTGQWCHPLIAEDAYKLADAMLVARESQQTIAESLGGELVQG